jgi:hypothetical protein
VRSARGGVLAHHELQEERDRDQSRSQGERHVFCGTAVLCGTHSSGSILKLSRRLVFLAKDETAAKIIQQALKQRALEVRFETGVAMPNRTDQQEFTKALRSAAVRAAHAAKIELAGRRLSATLTLEPDQAELRGMAKLLDARAEKAKRAADVLLGLAEGKLPTRADLEGFQTPASDAN